MTAATSARAKISKDAQIHGLKADVRAAEAAADSATKIGLQWKGLAEKREKELAEVREKARTSIDALKAALAGHVVTVAELNGYVRALLENDAIARGVTEQSAPREPASPPQPFRRQFPGDTPLRYAAPDIYESLSTYGQRERKEPPKQWYQR